MQNNWLIISRNLCIMNRQLSCRWGNEKSKSSFMKKARWVEDRGKTSVYISVWDRILRLVSHSPKWRKFKKLYKKVRKLYNLWVYQILKSVSNGAKETNKCLICLSVWEWAKTSLLCLGKRGIVLQKIRQKQSKQR